MAETTLEVRNPSGLHARPAALFVKTAAGFSSDIRVTNLTRDASATASARSLLGVLALGVSRGHRIRLEAEGPDAEVAIASLTELVESGIGEALEEAGG